MPTFTICELNTASVARLQPSRDLVLETLKLAQRSVRAAKRAGGPPPGRGNDFSFLRWPNWGGELVRAYWQWSRGLNMQAKHNMFSFEL